ncbi:site-specific integrase [Aquimarina longa]|uniref:site-specific integrase n=1 Tax=Aquimarina longa TaxID=1080221 RepID=UPI0007862553|nr:site-specific integrase [Aquimarina longa]
MKTTKRATFKILFYLKKNAPKKDGSIPVMGRITINGKITQFSTKISIDAKKWDISHNRLKGKSKEANEINQKLDAIRVRINDCYNRILNQNGYVSAIKVKNAFLGITTDEKMLLVVFQKYLDDFYTKVGKTKAKGSWAYFRFSFQHVKTFLKEKHNLKDIPFRELEEDFITDFEHYLIFDKKLHTNTIANYLKTLKRVVMIAVDKGWIVVSPFARHRVKKVKTNRAFLTKEELKQFGSVTVRTKNEELVRDLFVFCCFTGLSYVDLKNLTFDEIQRFWDKSLWIIKKRQKSKVKFSVRLLDTPLQIMKKYKGLGNDNLVFNVPSHSSCITHLKTISELAGITKHVTFHVSRHTCATLFLSNNVPIESVSKMLGHTNIRTTQIYARITNKKISEDMERLAVQLQNVESQLAVNF